MSKCDNCTHTAICKHKENMKQFEKEIAEMIKLLEYAEFSAETKCKHYRQAEHLTRT